MNKKVNRKLLKASGVLALVLVGALALLGLCELIVAGMKGRLDYLGAGRRWSSDGAPYAVIGMYAEESASVEPDTVVGWARSVDKELLNASVTPKDGARSWAWCYGCSDTLSVTGTKSSVRAETLAVGGDFFVFHQLSFTYGGGFLNDDSNPLVVVLDRDLAWQLYGAENIIGRTVTVNGVEFTVVGIAERESDDSVYRHVYGETPRMYMNYAGYCKVAYGDVTIFEAALPNNVRGFAMNIFKKAVSVNESAAVVIESSDRFSLENRFANMKQLKFAWISVNKIEYPYWENEARVYDYRAAVLMLFEIALAAVAVVSLLLSFILLRVSGYTLIDTAKNIWRKTVAKRAERNKNRPQKPKKKEVLHD